MRPALKHTYIKINLDSQPGLHSLNSLFLIIYVVVKATFILIIIIKYIVSIESISIYI